MPFLRLRDLRSDAALEFECGEVRIGRDPDLELPLSGDGSEVVSRHHARLVYEESRWWVEDAGSRNATYVDGRRLAGRARAPLAPGAVLTLGETGPGLRVEIATGERLPDTLDEESGALRLVLRDPGRDRRFEVAAARIRLGRGQECEVRPVEPQATAVSRVHAEVFTAPDGAAALLRDAGSLNGTFLNGRRVSAPLPLAAGDRIRLGSDGPELIVEEIRVRRRTSEAAPEAAERPAGSKPDRASAPRGHTIFLRNLLAEADRRSASRVRRIVWSLVALLAVAVGALYWRGESLVRATASALEQQERALAAQRARTDSVVRAAASEDQRLRAELEAARVGAAPAAVVDSLRGALAEADRRTRALEATLDRAQAALARELATGDSVRRAAQGELVRLRAELDNAQARQVPRELVDSLRHAVETAESRAAEIGAQLRAVRGFDLAAVAQANQGAVGLVAVYVGEAIYDGTGFALTRSGYFVTNRHVARPQGDAPDSVRVTMADERRRLRADIVVVAPPDGPDLAVLRIRGHSGPQVVRVDWSGANARQGEPAALIGFPAGISAALDRTRTVRTSMSAGIFSKVTPEIIQFDGFTVGGSSGSPVFNALGEVVGVHRGVLEGAVGLGFAVPIRQLIPLLPPAARTELGIP